MTVSSFLRRPLAARAARFAACLAAALTLAAPAAAQEAEGLPNLPDREQFGRPGDDFALQFCVDPRDPAWRLDLAMGEAIAAALLIEAQPVVLDDANEQGNFDSLYRYLLGQCRIFFGFKMIAAGYPDWLTLTRPYYRTGYVFVAPAPAPARLGDIPPGTPIATAVASTADFRFVQYNNSLPAARRWQRFPYSNDAAAMQAAVEGTAAAALVWAPTFAGLQQQHPEFAGLAVIDPAPLTLPDMPVAGVMLSRDTYLRSAIDRAIDALAADGSIARILAGAGIPGTAPD